MPDRKPSPAVGRSLRRFDGRGFPVQAIMMFRPPDAAPQQASLHLPRQTIDVGRVTAGEERTVAFKVANRGRRRLVINPVDGGCSCGPSTTETVLLAPGEAGQLVFSLDTRVASGPCEQVVAFTTNDPRRPGFQLSVRAVVASPNAERSAPFRKGSSVLVALASPQPARAATPSRLSSPRSPERVSRPR